MTLVSDPGHLTHQLGLSANTFISTALLEMLKWISGLIPKFTKESIVAVVVVAIIIILEDTPFI